jgi:uncharacterized small protein (DUF1192 family)
MTTGSSANDNTDGGDPLLGLGTTVEDEVGPARSNQAESVPHFLSRTGWWLIPFLLIVTGAGLGWADKNAVDTDTSLRIPALIVALLLFSQGLVDFKSGAKRSILEEVKAEVGQELLATEQRLATVKDELSRAKAELVKSRGGRVSEEEAAAVTEASTAPERAWLSLPGNKSVQDRTVLTSLLLMGLGIWLGVQLLTVAAPANLTVLSLIGVFLVFSAGARAVMGESS